MNTLKLTHTMKLVYVRDANGFPFAAIAINRRHPEDLKVAVGVSMYHVGSDDKFEKDLGRRIAIGRASRLPDMVEVGDFAFWVKAPDSAQETLDVLRACLEVKFDTKVLDHAYKYKFGDDKSEPHYKQTTLSTRVLRSIKKHIKAIEAAVKAKQDRGTPAVQATAAAE